MIEIIIIICVLLFSVILHECAHGMTAFYFGDPTAKEQGRLTLNPLSHIDPFGTFILPALLRFMGFFPIGWAKPVPVDFRRLRNPKKDMFFVSAAGPLTNIAIALFVSGLFHLSKNFALGWENFFATVIVINLILAFFNLIPIPPLDGSRLLLSLLPGSLGYRYAKLERFGIIIVLVLLNFGLFNIIGLLVAMTVRALGVNLII